jgi:hypothetical protein
MLGPPLEPAISKLTLRLTVLTQERRVTNNPVERIVQFAG